MSRYIDADALKDDILKSAVMIDDRGIQTGYEIAIELIKRQPTVDAVSVEYLKRLPSAEPVRHGKWTVTPTHIKCSECGESFMLFPQNYCPNCGCRMDEERKAE